MKKFLVTTAIAASLLISDGMQQIANQNAFGQQGNPCEICGGSGIETLGSAPDNDVLLAAAGAGGTGSMSGGSGTETLGSDDGNDHITNGGSQGGHCSNYCGSGFAPGGSGIGGIRGDDGNDHLTGRESKR